MRYSIFIVLIFFYSCSTNYTKIENRNSYNSKGFAYVYNNEDFENKIIKGKLDNSELQVSINSLKTNTILKIINLKTKDEITIKNTKRINFPDFYKILITKPVAEKLNINPDLPLVEILELKKNKSFVAKKAKIFSEEKKLSNKAPVDSVQISNISKGNIIKNKSKNDKIYIVIASFSTKEVATFLKKRIIKEIPDYDYKKLIISKKNNKKIDLISGPYNTINLMKNDYILLKQFGFEELDITLNE